MSFYENSHQGLKFHQNSTISEVLAMHNIDGILSLLKVPPNNMITSDNFMDLPGYLENIEHLIKNSFTLKKYEFNDVLMKT